MDALQPPDSTPPSLTDMAARRKHVQQATACNSSTGLCTPGFSDFMLQQPPNPEVNLAATSPWPAAGNPIPTSTPTPIPTLPHKLGMQGSAGHPPADAPSQSAPSNPAPQPVSSHESAPDQPPAAVQEPAPDHESAPDQQPAAVQESASKSEEEAVLQSAPRNESALAQHSDLRSAPQAFSEPALAAQDVPSTFLAAADPNSTDPTQGSSSSSTDLSINSPHHTELPLCINLDEEYEGQMCRLQPPLSDPDLDRTLSQTTGFDMTDPDLSELGPAGPNTAEPDLAGTHAAGPDPAGFDLADSNLIPALLVNPHTYQPQSTPDQLAAFAPDPLLQGEALQQQDTPPSDSQSHAGSDSVQREQHSVHSTQQEQQSVHSAQERQHSTGTAPPEKEPHLTGFCTNVPVTYGCVQHHACYGSCVVYIIRQSWCLFAFKFKSRLRQGGSY